MIIFENVSKRYASHQVLENLHLELQAGEFICLTGPSGAGKTTLISMLIGAERPDSGRILIDDIEISDLNNKDLQLLRRRIGMVFQDYKLLENKNIFENIAFAMEVCGWDESAINKKTRALLEQVGLDRHARNFPRELSGGEKQRVAIGRALSHDPSLLIADEPTGNLDHANARSIIDLLLEINIQGTTVILTTHNRELLSLIPKYRLINLQDGRITSDQIVKN